MFTGYSPKVFQENIRNKPVTILLEERLTKSCSQDAYIYHGACSKPIDLSLQPPHCTNMMHLCHHVIRVTAEQSFNRWWFFSMWSAEVRVYPPLLGLLKQTGFRPVVLPKQALVFIAMTDRSFHSYIHSWVQPDLPNAVKFDQIQTWFCCCCCCSFVFPWLTELLTVIHSYFTVNPQAPNNNNPLILWIFINSSLMIFFLCRTTVKFSVQLHVCL